MKLLLDYELLEGCAVVLCRWKFKKKKRQISLWCEYIYIFYRLSCSFCFMNDRREIKDITKDMHTERKLKCFPHKDMSLIEKPLQTRTEIL